LCFRGSVRGPTPPDAVGTQAEARCWTTAFVPPIPVSRAARIPAACVARSRGSARIRPRCHSGPHLHMSEKPPLQRSAQCSLVIDERMAASPDEAVDDECVAVAGRTPVTHVSLDHLIAPPLCLRLVVGVQVDQKLEVGHGCPNLALIPQDALALHLHGNTTQVRNVFDHVLAEDVVKVVRRKREALGCVTEHAHSIACATIRIGAHGVPDRSRHRLRVSMWPMCTDSRQDSSVHSGHLRLGDSETSPYCRRHRGRTSGCRGAKFPMKSLWFRPSP
jgi:hypothetical protein